MYLIEDESLVKDNKDKSFFIKMDTITKTNPIKDNISKSNFISVIIIYKYII